MKITTAFGVAAIGLALAACGNPTGQTFDSPANNQPRADGPAFRWRIQNLSGRSAMILVLVDLPSGPSRAEPILKKDILALIGQAEATEGRPDPQLEDIKLLRDGREVWILKSEGEGIAYVVRLKHPRRGGTEIELNGPQKYDKEKG